MRMIALLLALVIVACAAPAEEPQETTTPEAGTDPDREPDQTFSLTGENFAFFQGEEESPTLTVQEGDLVRIEFESTEGMHDWVVDEFDARTEIVSDGEGVVAVEFVADTAGEYEYYCSVGSHRENGMFGTLVVE